VRGRVVEERLCAMIPIWTRDHAEFHGELVDFDEPVRRCSVGEPTARLDELQAEFTKIA
jgi:hypothetical protein